MAIVATRRRAGERAESFKRSWGPKDVPHLNPSDIVVGVWPKSLSWWMSRTFGDDRARYNAFHNHLRAWIELATCGRMREPEEYARGFGKGDAATAWNRARLSFLIHHEGDDSVRPELSTVYDSYLAEAAGMERAAGFIRQTLDSLPLIGKSC